VDEKKKMGLVIVRIKEGGKQPERKILPVRFDDRSQAIEGIRNILATFPRCGENKTQGFNKEQGFWWARDTAGNQFKFVIEENGPDEESGPWPTR
jgi:hypothetical protein